MSHAPTDTMFFLPYTPRADSNDRGYEEWLRAVDNPFFNGVDGIEHYSNWKVASVLKGNIDFTHFDFMFVDRVKEPGIWTTPRVAEFAAGWTTSWGRDPDNADLSVNYHVYQLNHAAGPIEFSPQEVTVILRAEGDAPKAGSSWTVAKSVLGQCPCPRVDVVFGKVADLGDAYAAFTGTLLAAPAN